MLFFSPRERDCSSVLQHIFCIGKVPGSSPTFTSKTEKKCCLKARTAFNHRWLMGVSYGNENHVCHFLLPFHGLFCTKVAGLTYWTRTSIWPQSSDLFTHGVDVPETYQIAYPILAGMWRLPICTWVNQLLNHALGGSLTLPLDSAKGSLRTDAFAKWIDYVL